MLGGVDVDDGALRLIPEGVFDFIGDADDGDPRIAGAGAAHADPTAEGIQAVKVLGGKGAADDGDGRGLQPITRSESAAIQDGDVEGGEVAGIDDDVERCLVLAGNCGTVFD